MSVIEEIICKAREDGASDVYLAAGMPPKLRVGGALFAMDFSRITAADMLDILIGIMPEALRERFEEKGEYAFSFTLPEGGRCRADACRQRDGIALALRLIDGEAVSPENLGIPEPIIDLYSKERGLVLVAGPSGSGRSTTLTAMINKINDSRERLIVTLEEPVEYLHAHKRSMIVQREIGTDSKGYPEGITAAVRAGADVIVVGELRDAESVNAAIAAAEMGHLVLAGLNAAGVVDALEGMRDMFPADRQERMCARLAGVLEAVSYQQLNPTADGDGREAAFEVLLGSSKVRSHIREGKFSALFDAVQQWGRE